MNEFRYDTYCGLYCGACDILNAYRNGRQEELTLKYNQKMSLLASLFQVPPSQLHVLPSQIKCRGCKNEEVFVNCGGCPIRNCARGRGLEYCIECREFPCELRKQLRHAEEILPQTKTELKNLNTIKEKGLDFWLKEQEQLWKCPRCQASFTWWAEKCSGCGKELEPLKDYNQ